MLARQEGILYKYPPCFAFLTHFKLSSCSKASFSGKNTGFLYTMAPTSLRPVANFSPSLWGEIFCTFVEDKEGSELYAGEIEKLKEEVRNELVSIRSKVVDKIILIDTIERLGVSYHFHKEIDEQLEEIFLWKANIECEEEAKLFCVALKFRLFRQHGYRISCDVFEEFKDMNGNFKEAIKSDIKGLLSLYEAANVRIKGEKILDEALSFTAIHLQSWASDENSVLGKQVKHALFQSIHKGYPRIEARHFIAIYEDYDSKDQTLLRLAKLDFNLLQMLHKKELYGLSRWWNEMGLISKLTYPRDRLVECYYFALGVYYEPQYSLARIILAKFIAMISVIDDTYDSYGTVEELEVFTDALQRWNIGELDRLPDYMKIVYKAILDLFDNLEIELREKGRSYALNHTKEAMKQITRSYNIEAKWFLVSYLPKFDEYMTNGLITSTNYLLVPASYIGMEEATQEAFAWLLTNPKIIRATSTIGRIIDDVATYEFELERGQLATGIECYMREYEVTEREAVDKFHEIAENAWKDLTEQFMKPTPMPREILLRLINFSRLIDVTYKNDQDGYTNPEKVIKHHIISILVDPITI